MSLYQHWAKSGEQGHHLLVYHGLDVSSVAESWVEHNFPFVSELADRSLISAKAMTGILRLFSALHDAGKFSVTFQNLRPELLMRLQGRESGKTDYSVRHDDLGWMLWESHLQSCVVEHLKEYSSIDGGETHLRELLDVFARLAFGHHGRPTCEHTKNFESLFWESDIEAALEYTSSILELHLSAEAKMELARWPNNSKTERKSALRHLKQSSWRLAGAMVLSDWVASGGSFPFVEDTVPLSEYFETAQEIARDAFLRIGLYSAGQSSRAGFAHLFPSYSTCPTPLQTFCDDVEVSAGPQLWILEDVTGSGKTEAACTLVSRLMEKRCAEGAFVALPTMATSNAMYERMGQVYHLLFAENVIFST